MEALLYKYMAREIRGEWNGGGEGAVDGEGNGGGRREVAASARRRRAGLD